MGERPAEERQRQAKRARERGAGAEPGRHARRKTSISVPMTTKIESPIASGAKIEQPRSHACATTAVTAPMMMAKPSL